MSNQDYTEHLGGKKQAAVAIKPKLSVTVSTKEGKGEPVVKQDEQKELAPVITSGTPAVVSVSAGRTINLGNFNSAKVEVSLSFPCDPDDIDECYKHVYGWVDGKMDALMKENGLGD